MKYMLSLLVLIIVAITGGCTTPGSARETKQSASIVDYLYPSAAEAPKLEPGIALLKPPVRVGLAFAPVDVKARSLPEAEKIFLQIHPVSNQREVGARRTDRDPPPPRWRARCD